MSQSHLVIRQQILPQGVKFFVYLAMTYMFLLTAFYFLQAEAIKHLANAFAFIIFGILLAYVIFVRRVGKLPASLVSSLLIFYMGMLACLIVNGFAQDMPVFAKMLIGPAFIVLGYAMGRTGSLISYVPRNLYLPLMMLLVIPLFLIVIDVIKGTYALGDTNTVGIFANRNNAALYMISLLALLNNFHIKRAYSLTFALLVGLLFGKLGVCVAVVFALTFVFLTRSNFKYVLFSLLFVVVSILIFPENPLLPRFEAAYDSLQVLYGSEGVPIAEMTYGQLYRLTGTSDLSLFFRLKHWDEIFSLWEQASLASQLFGSGVGSAENYTTAGLVPHNDYLRYFYECGVIAFIGFVSLQWTVLNKIGRNYLIVPFLVISFYFVSENLVNNYLAMIIYYFSAGLILRQTGHGNNKVNKTTSRFLYSRTSFSGAARSEV